MGKLLFFLILFFNLFVSVKGQKGEVSISAGPFLSFIQNNEDFFTRLGTGVGLEAMGQYNFSNRSSFLIQTNFASYGVKPKVNIDTGRHYRQTIYSLKVGYKYQFGTSGFFTNFLAGVERFSGSNMPNSSFSLGVGKRFLVKDIYFIDFGVDGISRPTDIRFNIKVLFSLFRTPKQ